MGLSFLAMGALLPQQGGFCWRRGYSTRPYASARCPINTAVLYHRVKDARDTIPDFGLRIVLLLKGQVKVYRVDILSERLAQIFFPYRIQPGQYSGAIYSWVRVVIVF